MSNIKSWSSTAASNTDATWGGMPEGMAPSAVNDNVRTQMAAHRTQWEDAEWFDWGHVPAYVSASTFTVSNSVTLVYAIGRRLKLGGIGSDYLYGHVTSISAVSGTNTKFTVSLTSGNLTSSLSTVAVAILDPTNTSIPKGATLDTPTINGTATGTTWAGHVLQVVNTVVSTYDSTTNTIPVDDTIPQQGGSEGKEFMSLAITPKSASNKLKIDVVAVLSHTVDTATFILALFQDSTASAIAATVGSVSAASGAMTMCLTYYMDAGTTSSTTFKVRAGAGVAGTTGFNGSLGGRYMGGVMASSITITEIKV
jgi:hypothetical protein